MLTVSFCTLTVLFPVNSMLAFACFNSILLVLYQIIFLYSFTSFQTSSYRKQCTSVNAHPSFIIVKPCMTCLNVCIIIGRKHQCFIDYLFWDFPITGGTLVLCLCSHDISSTMWKQTQYTIFLGCYFDTGSSIPLRSKPHKIKSRITLLCSLKLFLLTCSNQRVEKRQNEFEKELVFCALNLFQLHHSGTSVYSRLFSFLKCSQQVVQWRNHNLG